VYSRAKAAGTYEGPAFHPIPAFKGLKSRVPYEIPRDIPSRSHRDPIGTRWDIPSIPKGSAIPTPPKELRLPPAPAVARCNHGPSSEKPAVGEGAGDDARATEGALNWQFTNSRIHEINKSKMISSPWYRDPSHKSTDIFQGIEPRTEIRRSKQMREAQRQSTLKRQEVTRQQDQ
jgi:hypothetical protein